MILTIIIVIQIMIIIQIVVIIMRTIIINLEPGIPAANYLDNEQPNQ